jgi:amino acid permease
MIDDLNTETTTPPGLNNGQTAPSQDTEKTQKQYVIIASLVILVILTLLVLATIYLVNPDNSARTEQIRDVFIIFLALESLVIGVALVVLIVQLSNLINLLQNEIRPIINSTNETVNTLKGTAKFVSDNLAEPVIKINQYAAMIKRIVKPSKD